MRIPLLLVLILVGPGAALSDANQKRGVSAYCDLATGAKLPYLRLENLDISGFHEGIQIGAWHASFSGFRDVLVTGCVIHDNLGNGLTTYGGYLPSSASQQSHANVQVVGCEVMRDYGDPTLSNPGAQHAGSGSASVAGPRVAAPTWLKLSRRGSVFSAYQSADGAAWTLVANRTVGDPGHGADRPGGDQPCQRRAVDSGVLRFRTHPSLEQLNGAMPCA